MAPVEITTSNRGKKFGNKFSFVCACLASTTSILLGYARHAQGASIAISVNRVVSGAVSMSFLSLSRAISFGGTFFLFAGISAVGLVLFYCCSPETNGQSLEELAHIFEKRPSEEEAGPNIV